MNSRTQSGKTVSVAQSGNEQTDAGAGGVAQAEAEATAVVEADAERGAAPYKRGNGATNDHVTVEDTFTAPTDVTQREGASGVGRDNIALAMREDDEGGVTAPVAAQVDSDEIMAKVGVTDGGQSTVTSKQREMDIETEQGENVVFMGGFDFADTGEDPYDWTCAFDDQSRTLEQEERAAGVKAEFDRHHERAHTAHEHGEVPEQANAEANRRLARSWLEQSSSPAPLGTNVIEVREQMEAEEAKAHPRVRTPKTKELAGDIYKAAKRVREKYAEACPKIHLIAKDIAERVADGAGLNEAVLAVDESIRNKRPISSQRQYIENVSPSQWEATIEGEVTKLFDPLDGWSQQQVAYINDGTGTCKVTVWNNSYKDTLLHEGDRVRVIDGEPGWYDGMPTLAVSGRTELWVVEEGDGPAPQGAKRYNPPNFSEPSMAEIHRRRTYRHRNPKRRLSANPNKRFEK